ncbi:subtilisin-like protein [Lactarius akahatsu]|uniref:Subtilisin-like protein n=1 Tax=Lactarius akahatsu TaxID=416441 RepID=A0AAD4L744_9AGAM|nr:subtilisin-like protein [Lactarius akahatsu]
MYHHCISILFVVVVVLLGSLAKPPSPPWDDMHIKHSWNAVPKNWETLGRPPSGTTIDLYIALRPQREDAVVDALYDVSEPGHPRNARAREFLARTPRHILLVHFYDARRQYTDAQSRVRDPGQHSPRRHRTSSTGTSRGGETIIRTVGYSLPVALHWHVWTVAPTTSFVSLRTQWQALRNRSDRAAVKSTSGGPATMLSSRAKVNPVTPSFLRWLYDTEAYTPNTRGENVLGIAGFLGEYPSQADLGAFMRKYLSEAEDATFNVVEVNGGVYDPTHPHEEANMVIQYAEAMAYPTPHIFYNTGQGPSGMDGDFVSWLEYILDQENIPQTISISYSIEERFLSRDMRPMSLYYRRRAERRTTSRRVAAEFSGGGFSDYFERPTYQEEAASTFLQDLGNRYQGLYKSLLAAASPTSPAQAVGFRIFLNGNEHEASGPSRLPQPWLYGRGSQGLTDITEGSNTGCNMDGFSAIVGWDPVTGLGTPRFRRMLEQLFEMNDRHN